MKRYASHFLFIPKHGYLKQHVVEAEDGYVVRVFPLTEEIEDVEWLPGAIVLMTQEELKELDNISNLLNTKKESSKIANEFYYNSTEILVKFPSNLLSASIPLINRSYGLSLVYFSQFDITKMQPVCGTRHRQLP